MKALAIAIVASILLPVHSPAQETMWHTEGHDSLLVAPDAHDVKYVRAAMDTLTYTVDVPYPAPDVVGAICSDLQRKGWQATVGCSHQDQWWKYGPGGTAPYARNLIWVSPGGDDVEYHLDYDEPLPGERNPEVLHVRADFTPSEAIVRPTRTFPVIPVTVFRAVVNLVGFGLILGTVIVLQLPKVNSIVFYMGLDSWVTSTNLVFFGPVAATFFAFDLLFIIQQFGEGGEGASIAGGIAAVGLMWLIGKISFVICAVVLFLTYRTLSAKSIPGKVKKVHFVLNIASIAFFGLCGYLAYFADQPLFHW
jgi:hypothetical protein